MLIFGVIVFSSDAQMLNLYNTNVVTACLCLFFFRIPYVSYVILYENIDLTLLNKLHGLMRYKIGGTCVYNGHAFYTLVVKTRQSSSPYFTIQQTV